MNVSVNTGLAELELSHGCEWDGATWFLVEYDRLFSSRQHGKCQRFVYETERGRRMVVMRERD